MRPSSAQGTPVVRTIVVMNSPPSAVKQGAKEPMDAWPAIPPSLTSQGTCCGRYPDDLHGGRVSTAGTLLLLHPSVEGNGYSIYIGLGGDMTRPPPTLFDISSSAACRP